MDLDGRGDEKELGGTGEEKIVRRICLKCTEIRNIDEKIKMFNIMNLHYCTTYNGQCE